MLRWRAVVLACFFLLAAVPAAKADGRVALVVGNSNYRYTAPLANPVNDAKLVAETLRRIGFKLVGGGPVLDVDKAQFDAAVQQFGSELTGAEVGLFYYAGHGVEVRGANYLVPAGAKLGREADIDFQMLNASLVLRQMEGAGTKLNIAVLDACRDNPFGGSFRSPSRGLAPMQAPEGTIIAYATQPGNVAEDGDGANSPFAAALASVLPRPGLEAAEAFNEIALKVKKDTRGRQLPWLAHSPIEGKFYFAGGVGSAGAVAKAAAEPAFAPGAVSDAVRLEVAFWESVRGSNSAADVQKYLDRYPGGSFAPLARSRIAALQAPAQAAQTAGAAPEGSRCLPFDVKQRFSTTVTVEFRAEYSNLIFENRELCWKDGTIMAVVGYPNLHGPMIMDPARQPATGERGERRWGCPHGTTCFVKTQAATVSFRSEAMAGEDKVRRIRLHIESRPN